MLAIWIKIDSEGPVFYRQVRVGKGNRDFQLFKFRSMRVGSDQKGLITVGGRDPRVTRSGYYIRKYKLDELPQLINVFIGDMSLVGPRPEVRKYVDLYTPEIARLVQEEFRAWRTLMEQCLIRIYGEEVGMHEAEAMMILIAGTFICNYNQALTGEINDNILGYLGNLSRS